MNQTFSKTKEKANSFRYLVSKFNKEGWADASKSSPIPFDLVTICTNRNKEISGWWTGHKWEGARLKNKEIVLFWKRRRYEHLT